MRLSSLLHAKVNPSVQRWGTPCSPSAALRMGFCRTWKAPTVPDCTCLAGGPHAPSHPGSSPPRSRTFRRLPGEGCSAGYKHRRWFTS